MTRADILNVGLLEREGEREREGGREGGRERERGERVMFLRSCSD